MQVFAHATGFWWGTRSLRRPANRTTRHGRIAALFARIAKQLPRTEDDIADRYSGCGWGDEIERRVLDSVFNGRRGSI